MPVNIDIENFLEFSREVDAKIGAGLKEGAQAILDLASQLAPRDTEELSQSGQVNETGYLIYEVSFGNGLPDDRAQAQEYGTVFMPAQPYLTPAATEVDVVKYVSDKIGD